MSDEEEVEIEDIKTQAQKLENFQEEDVDRDICLPSIKDSKLWRVKVTPGRERELVFKITNKLIPVRNLFSGFWE